jgi:outer membrane lipoprotein carrier protein
MRVAWIFGVMLGLMTMSWNASATGLDRLNEYFANVQTMAAELHQTVFNRKGQKTQDVNGRMLLQKPNKFRWDYQKPYAQAIVGNGEKVWVFDEDLNQVTVKSFTKLMGNTPAAMLAGGKDMEKYFDVQEGDSKDDLEWALAKPKTPDSGFESVALGFRGEVLSKMELVDSFGNRTVIEFSKVLRNPKIPASSFNFKAPAGADVLVSD